MKTENELKKVNVELAEVAATTITKEQAMAVLIRLFVALENATGNSAVALDIIGKIADGIESDPEFSRKILTPENIAKAYALKAKSDKGDVRFNDIDEAFPALMQAFPMLAMVKNLIPKKFQ